MCIRDREQIGKIDVQNQSNNAQVTQQNLNAFTTGINQNQQTNNQYKQNYDQLVPVSYTHLTLPTSDLV